MKKLINRPEAVVDDMLQGMVAAYPWLRLLSGHKVLVRGDIPEPSARPVAILSGGGSGHEPAHGGYVGRGMLAAAVAGEVFTSPSPDAVLAALRAVAGPIGAVLVVKNYTGDRLNFGLAAEMARAEGIPVEMVLVADDMALADSVDNAGRRGLAGTILVHKVAGAAAAMGASLQVVTSVARAAASAVRTMGVALTPCTVPAAGRPGFTLGDQEIELGLGIHGEPGVRRGPLQPADSLVDTLIDTILRDGKPAADTPVVLLVNNLGGTPTMELTIVARRAVANLEQRGLLIERVYVGTFLSALEMAGISLSILPVDIARLALLDASTDAPAWPAAVARQRVAACAPAEEQTSPPVEPTAAPPATPLGKALETALRSATTALIQAGDHLTRLDQASGDGDLGISLDRGARAVQAALPTWPLDDPGATLQALSRTLQTALGGTSGPLYAVFFLRAAGVLKAGGVKEASTWVAAFDAGCAALADLGGAAAGDRTMLDALLPAATALRDAVAAGRSLQEVMAAMAAAALAGAAATTHMKPRRGRSSYLGDRALGQRDPGAEAVAIWIKAVAEG